MKPEISIIIPSYNYDRFITRAIDSVINQTFKNWELIIIDDGSKDDSIRLIKQYEDKRITFLVQKNCGVSKTLNRGLRISQGKYICFLDADDKYHPEKLQNQIDLIKSGYDISITKVEAIDENGLGLPDEHFNQTWNLFNPVEIFDRDIIFRFIEKNYFCKSSVMIKKSFFDKYGLFNENLITAYDLELWLKFIPNARIDRCEKILTYYRWHQNNETKTNNTRIKIELLLILDQFIESQLTQASESLYTKFANSFGTNLKENNLVNAYITLQFIKNNNKLDNIYDILSCKKMFDLLSDTLQVELEPTKEPSINQQNENFSRFKNLRRKIIPFKLRRFLKKFVSGSK